MKFSVSLSVHVIDIVQFAPMHHHVLQHCKIRFVQNLTQDPEYVDKRLEIKHDEVDARFCLADSFEFVKFHASIGLILRSKMYVTPKTPPHLSLKVTASTYDKNLHSANFLLIRVLSFDGNCRIWIGR